MLGIDASYQIATAILKEVRGNVSEILTEEDAKLQIITRLLTEALGWSHSDIAAERKHDNGYSDYLLADGGHDTLVVEAKRLGLVAIPTHATRKQYYKISGPALKDALFGIVQAATYCGPLGVQLAVLTDGYTWVVFRPYIAGEKYQDKQAVVFPGFDAILADFAQFYELLAKAECRKNTYKIIFDQIHENRLTYTAALEAPYGLDTLRIEQKSSLAFDLDKVFTGFFATLSGEDDPDLQINCFVETRESRVADFSLEKITTNVLGNLASQDRSVDEGLHSLIKTSVESDDGETVFIVGPSGAGKSTFLDRFFRKTLPPSIRERCVVITLNMLDATGDEGTLLPWATNKVTELIEARLYEDGYPKWNDLQALYHTEYVRRSEGIDAALYTRDKEAFKEKFSTYVENQVHTDREGYLRRLVADLIHNRHFLPIFVVDNTDEFSISVKEMIFQYFQSVRRAARHCLLMFPATDRSAWSFSKTEIFNIHSSKSFFLPTPSPREVFRKRVDYLKKKLEADTSEKTKAEYFAKKGIRVTIGDLSGFASIVENVFVDQDYSSKILGEISNYNMRKTLALSKRVITSAEIEIDEIIRSYIVGEPVTPSYGRFSSALLKGDYNFYRQGDDHQVFPLFQVDSEIRQSPLIHTRVLWLLKAIHLSASDDRARYTAVGSIYRYFDLMGMSEIAIERSLIALLGSGLIEPYDLSKKEYSQDQQLAITYAGLAHLDLGLSNTVFFEQFALTTRITDPDVATRIREAYSAKGPLAARLENLRSIFCEYLLNEDRKFAAVPATSEFVSQVALTEDLHAQWIGKREKIRRLGPDKSGLVATDVAAVVDMFDNFKGFGFVTVDALRDSAFVGSKLIEATGLGELHDGDGIRCDVSRNEKGLFVSKIYEITSNTPTQYTAEIVRLFPDRGYGFIHLPDTGRDAFFHVTLFTKEDRDRLHEGVRLPVEVVTDANGRSQVKRLVGEPIW